VQAGRKTGKERVGPPSRLHGVSPQLFLRPRPDPDSRRFIDGTLAWRIQRTWPAGPWAAWGGGVFLIAMRGHQAAGAANPDLGLGRRWGLGSGRLLVAEHFWITDAEANRRRVGLRPPGCGCWPRMPSGRSATLTPRTSEYVQNGPHDRISGPSRCGGLPSARC